MLNKFGLMNFHFDLSQFVPKWFWLFLHDKFSRNKALGIKKCQNGRAFWQCSFGSIQLILPLVRLVLLAEPRCWLAFEKRESTLAPWKYLLYLDPGAE